MSTGRKTVLAWCPICRCPIPLFEVVVHVSGWFRRDVGVTVNGDATDFIAHVWSHEKKEINHG